MMHTAGAMLVRAALLSALLVPAHAAPAAALSCVHHAFQAPGERFSPRQLIAHVEVLDVRAARTMDVRVLRLLHGREERPVVSVDIAQALGWNMPRQWGFEPFSLGTQWVIVMVPAPESRAAAGQPELCRAYLRMEGEHAVGYVRDLSTRKRVTLVALAATVAKPQSPVGGSTRTR
jgi:hypothetical protein